MINLVCRLSGAGTGFIGHIAMILLLCLIGSAPGRAGPLDTLAAADKDLNAGEYARSIRQADSAIASGKLAPAELARALYIRGSGYLASGKSSKAIVDLNAALWMKKLPDRLQRDAKAKRYQAYTGVGVAPRQTVATRPTLTQQTARRAPPSQPSAVVGGHKVALPMAPRQGLPEGTHTRPLVLNKPRPVQPKTITAPLPVTQTPPQSASAAQWTSTTRRAALPSSIRPSPPTAGTRRATIPAQNSASLRPQRVPPRNSPAVQRAASRPSPSAVGAFTTRTIATPPPVQVAHQQPQPARPLPQAAKTTAPSIPPLPVTNAQPTTFAPSAPALGLQLSNGVRDGIYEETRPSRPTAQADTSASTTGWFGGLLDGDDAKSEAVVAADELQRRRTEQIRAHNRRWAGEE